MPPRPHGSRSAGNGRTLAANRGVPTPPGRPWSLPAEDVRARAFEAQGGQHPRAYAGLVESTTGRTYMGQKVHLGRAEDLVDDGSPTNGLGLGFLKSIYFDGVGGGCDRD